MKITKVLSLICALTLIACGSALAQDKGKKKEKKSAEKPAPARSDVKRADVKIDITITQGERDAIRAYCVQFEQPGKKGRKAKSLPPGLAKKVARGGRLPPGWEKKLVVGEIVPEPVFKECQPLPPEIVIKLAAPPPGTILRAIEGRILRLHEKTLEILDVFDPFH